MVHDTNYEKICTDVEDFWCNNTSKILTSLNPSFSNWTGPVSRSCTTLVHIDWLFRQQEVVTKRTTRYTRTCIDPVNLSQHLLCKILSVIGLSPKYPSDNRIISYTFGVVHPLQVSLPPTKHVSSLLPSTSSSYFPIVYLLSSVQDTPRFTVLTLSSTFNVTSSKVELCSWLKDFLSLHPTSRTWVGGGGRFGLVGRQFLQPKVLPLGRWRFSDSKRSAQISNKFSFHFW